MPRGTTLREIDLRCRQLEGELHEMSGVDAVSTERRGTLIKDLAVRNRAPVILRCENPLDGEVILGRQNYFLLA